MKVQRIQRYIKLVFAQSTVYAGAFLSFLFGAPQIVLAASYDFLPQYVRDIMGAVGVNMTTGKLEPDVANTYIRNRVRLVITLVFVAFFIISIIYALINAIKIATSQGESGKMEEGKSGYKALALAFAGAAASVAGMFIILFLLGGETGPSTTINIDPDAPTNL